MQIQTAEGNPGNCVQPGEGNDASSGGDSPLSQEALGLPELLFIYFRICLHHLSKNFSFFFGQEEESDPSPKSLLGPPGDHTWDPSPELPSPSLFWLFREMPSGGTPVELED